MADAHNFAVGLVRSLPVLRETDVLLTSHGADMINAFGMRQGASVFEVMPVYQAGCPCKMYKEMASSEGGAGPVIFHYQFATRNKSMAVTNERRKQGTYHMNLILPWPELRRGLLHALDVGGLRKNYEYRTFAY